MKDYQIIDNFVEPKLFQRIKKEVMSMELPWYFNDVVTPQNNSYKLQAEKCYYFTHMVYNYDRPQSEFFNLLGGLLEQMDVKALVRIKLNLYPNIGEKIKNAFHVDEEFEHKGAILYLNTNDGPTTLEDGTEIEAVENRMLFFKAHKPHCSCHPTNVKQRYNINFNYF